MNMCNIAIAIHPWWQVTKAFPTALIACKLMVKLLLGEEHLHHNTYINVHPTSVHKQLCNVCTNVVLETAKHFPYVSEPIATSQLHLETTVNTDTGGPARWGTNC